MSAAVVLAIVVATQNIDDQATEAMRSTAVEAIGGEDAVVVREIETPSDAEALRIEQVNHAHTAAVVEWLDPAHTHARVRVHVAETGRWTERAVNFSAVDTLVERGRALGFAVISMLPDEALAARPHRGSARVAAAPGSVGAPDSDDLRTALRLVGIGGTGLFGGVAGGLGAAFAGEFFLRPDLSLRLGFGGRRGNVPQLAGSDLALHAAVGGDYWLWPPAADRRIALGVRADLLAIYHSVSDERPEAAVPRSSKLLPGFDLFGEVALSLAPAFEVIGSLGVEVALGSTQLQIKEEGVVGDVSWLRGVAEIGIRLLF